MVVRSFPARPLEEQLAVLAEAAYRAALQHGLSAAFVDVELAIWKALRDVVSHETSQGTDALEAVESALCKANLLQNRLTDRIANRMAEVA